MAQRHTLSWKAAALALVLVLAGSTGRAAAQDRPAWELGAHTGVVRHEFGEHTAVHAVLGGRLMPLRLGAWAMGLNATWWPDAVSLGAAFGDRRIEMDYFLYGVDLERALDGPGRSTFSVALGAGAQTMRFGERFEAAALLPESSTAPMAGAGVGWRIPLVTGRGEFGLRLDGRGRAANAEIFDPTGIRDGRELTFIANLGIGLYYRR